MTNDELAPKEGETSEQFKARIMEKQRELDAQAKTQPVSEPASQPVTEPVIPNDPAPQANAEPTDKPQENVPTSGTDVAPVPPKGDKAADVDEFAKKKGWKTQDDIIKSYRELEKKLGEQGKIQPPAPQYPNYGYPQVPPAQYYPPPPPPAAISQIARMYPNLAPEDIERVAPMIMDFSEAIADRKVRALEERFLSSERERQRESEIQRLKQDPHFQNPEVLSEMGQILESDPRIAKEPNGLTYAFKEALANVGRKRLEGSAPTDAQAQPSGQVLPTKPPTTARGTGPANVGKPGIKALTPLDPATFSGLPLAEKKRALRAIGALREAE